MSTLNVSVLQAARESYTQQLKLHLTPLIYEGLVSLYEDAKKIEEETNEYGGNHLKQFQKQLTNIPSWNQSILEEETRRILTEVDFLMDMVAAVFVSHVQILASVKLGGRNSKIRVRIPTSDIFIHMVYCKTAETFYYNPYKFDTYHVRESNEYIREMINRNIDDTVNSMIPIESIIKEYISNVFTSHVKDNPKMVDTVEQEPPGQVLDHHDLGLDSFNTPFNTTSEDRPDTPVNDSFGAGLGGDSFDKVLGAGMGGEVDFTDDLGVGKDEPEKFNFKDDETDIFSMGEPAHAIKEISDDSSPFKDITENLTKDVTNDPIFQPMSGGGDEDPFKSSGEDPFKTISIEKDPFLNDSGIGSGLDSVPSPPELDKDSIFSQKQEEVNFFEDLP